MTPGTFVEEVRRGVRTLLRARPFTLAAVITLAIGVA